jgi:hypothetical protein
MTGIESEDSAKDSPIVRALGRWEWEGGSSVEPDWERRAALIQEDERILHCLGAAVIMRWNNLPVEVQRELFASAVSLSDSLPTLNSKRTLRVFCTVTRMGDACTRLG